MAEQATGAKPSSGMASLFDLRLIIALLFGIYGVVLTFVGLFDTTEADLFKTGGININLWTGVSMLAVTAFFVIWTVARPLRMPAEAEAADDATGAGGH
ncbi:hypothetical protein M8C13_29825 [Crossiella sp. SN42]|uniref:hypothetical protein n=1 Tax=Crossiella sp. SN42 TaxID=2944808 RepID=UPI00207C4DE4|nr:hypothetical protein [Crossiella sp. SN42]MCO1579959.1 hypothetical protein [Crossiella sp. SN42]